jgi:hypothetical protein
MEMTPLSEGDDFINSLSAHHFPTLGAGFEMAMFARLVAKQAAINLQGRCVAAIQLKSMPRENLGKRLNYLQGLTFGNRSLWVRLPYLH